MSFNPILLALGSLQCLSESIFLLNVFIYELTCSTTFSLHRLTFDYVNKRPVLFS